MVNFPKKCKILVTDIHFVILPIADTNIFGRYSRYTDSTHTYTHTHTTQGSDVVMRILHKKELGCHAMTAVMIKEEDKESQNSRKGQRLLEGRRPSRVI